MLPAALFHRCVLACCVLSGSLLLGGCLERKLQITSEPAGATCWLNDQEVGVTPLEVDFTYYGEYSVRLKKEGCEPLVTKATAKQPLYERPPLDLAATALPTNVETVIKWHFVLEPAKEISQSKDQFETDLLQRARQMRDGMDSPSK